MLPHTGLFLLWKVALQMRIRRPFFYRQQYDSEYIPIYSGLTTDRHGISHSYRLRLRLALIYNQSAIPTRIINLKSGNTLSV